jgi:crossover junction endodeoxyribonuclease RuvC
MLIIGIDPGKQGAAVLMQQGTKDVVSVIRFSDSTLHDIAADLAEWKEFDSGPVLAVLEQVHAMPKQGVSSTFKFGQGFGRLEGMLTALKIPYRLVTPNVWQKAMGCQSKGDKNVTKAAAQRLYPALKITHATADAILIARYEADRYSREERI